MNKYGKLLITLLASITLLSGCTFREHSILSISNDKNVSLSVIVAMDDEMINAALTSTDNSDVEITEEKQWDYLDKELSDSFKNMNKEKYEKDGFKGYVFKTEYVPIDDLVGDNFEGRYEIGSSSEFKDGKLFTKKDDVYTSFFKFGVDEELSSYLTNQDNFDIKMIVELPNKSISNNATEISKDGKTLTWNITKDTDVDFSFSFAKTNYSLIAIIGAISLLVISFVFILIKNKNK